MRAGHVLIAIHPPRSMHTHQYPAVEMGYDRVITWKPLAEVSGVKAGAF